MFVNPPFGIIVLLLAVVPVLGVYNYHKAHKLTVNEKTLKLSNKEIFKYDLIRNILSNIFDLDSRHLLLEISQFIVL